MLAVTVHQHGGVDVSVAQHYAVYLYTEGYLSGNYCIDNKEFKNIFEEKYKVKFPLRAKSSNILSAMNLLKLIKKRNSADPDKIYFNRNVFDILIREYPDEKLKNHPDKNLGKTKQFKSPPNIFHNKKEKSADIQGLHCLLCREHLSSEDDMKLHEQTVEHKLRSLYRHKREDLKGECYNIDTATVYEGHEMENDPCVVNLEEAVNVEIVLSNNNETSCTVTHVTELMPSSEIQLSYNLPSVIAQRGKIQFSIKATFHAFAYVDYPVIFHIIKANKEIFVLHEMVFSVEAAVFSCPVPYKGQSKHYKNMGKGTVYPFISEVPRLISPKSSRDAVPLQDYPLLDDVIDVINCGFVEKPGMKTSVKYQLRKFLGMLKKTRKGRFISNMNEENYSEFMRFLLYMEEHKMSMDIRHYDRHNETMEFDSKKGLYILKLPGLSENRPSVLNNDKIEVRINGEAHVYVGSVVEVREEEVGLRFREPFVEKFVENLKLSISFKVNRYPLRLQHRALILLKSHEMTSLMFPNECSCSSSAEVRSWFNHLIETNEEQKTAVRNIVSGSFFPSPYVVFGPPGTGKTVTIVEAILQIWKNCDGARILACTPSNAAADVLTTRIQKHVPKASILRMFADCCNYYNIPEDIKQSSNFDPEEKIFNFSREEVQKKQIVISTLITAGRLVTIGVPDGHFTHIFIDESGHAPEPELLVSVCGLLTSSSHRGILRGRLILAGDPKQLGPILRSAPASDLGLGISFLERLVTKNEQYKRRENGEYNTAVITKLVKNFRSHEQILKVPNELFYENELKACDGGLTRRACRWSQLPKRDFPIIFHGVQGKDQREPKSPSYFNLQEINVVMKYVEALFKERLSGYQVREEDIGIITPYRKQVHKFRESLSEKWPGITVGTVEEFQGQERLIILISSVRSSTELLEDDYRHHLGFLKNPKRFNVAVTRGKSLLIVVGNPYILQYDRSWRTLLEFCYKNGAYRGCKYQPKEEISTDEDDDDDDNNDDDSSDSDETSALDIASLRLDESSNVEDGPQWRSEM